jgi:RNA polymerase sigma-70 factor (ECF subfamily)
VAVWLYLLGHSIPEAAGLLAFDEKRTENLIYRGMADLRNCLRVKGLKP